MKRSTPVFLGIAACAAGVFAQIHAADLKTGAVWLDKCARCHGDTGSGDTPLGKKLKVSDYSSKKAQENFTDDYVHRLIIEGKIINGKTVMPAYKDELADNEVQDLIVYIRSLAK